MTKDERREYERRWRNKHREKVKAYNRKYYLSHLLTANYKKASPERRKEYNRAYYEKHKDDEAHKQKMRAYQKQWRKQNRERLNAYNREYRKRKALEV